MPDTHNTTPQKGDASQNTEEAVNIFEDFVIDDKLKKEVNSKDNLDKKDIFYYLSLGNTFGMTVNIVLFITLVFAYLYIHIQENNTDDVYFFAKPFCSFLIGKSDIYTQNCPSITYAIGDYENKKTKEQNQQAEIIGPLLVDIYSYYNFFASKKVDFLLTKSQHRLRPLEILKDFDALHRSYFDNLGRNEIICKNFVFNADLTLTVDCEAFSASINDYIRKLGPDGYESVSGTSISLANFFIDYIENEEKSNFRVIQKPNMFTTQAHFDQGFVYKTPFRLQLEYKNDTTILY